MVENSKIDEILYELNCKEYMFIKNVIIELNNLGFITVVSQPGKKQIYYNEKKNKIIDRRQRAYIHAYLKPELAFNLVKEYGNNPNIFVRSSIHNKTLNPDLTCTCGSVEFENDKPCTMYFNLGDFSQSFNFKLPLRRPFITYKNSYEYLIDLSDDNNLIEFDILDLRWGENEIWNDLLNKVKKYCVNI